MTTSRHLSVSITAPAKAVYAYVSDPTNLPEWAAGLARATVEERDGRWFAESPMGRVRVDFAPPNEFGVLDHTVTLPSGETVLNPLRVLPDGDGSEVVFTVRRRPEMSEAEFETDCGAVATDLETLRTRLERA